MERDPSGQLAWLVSELEAAEKAGERVWLMGHMPLGESSTLSILTSYSTNTDNMPQDPRMLSMINPSISVRAQVFQYPYLSNVSRSNHPAFRCHHLCRLLWTHSQGRV